MQMVCMHKIVKLLDNFHDVLSFSSLREVDRVNSYVSIRKSGHQRIVYQCNPGSRTFSSGLNQAPLSRKEEGRGGFDQGVPDKYLDQYLDLTNILDQ